MWPLKAKSMYPDMELALNNFDLIKLLVQKKQGEGVALTRFKKKKQKFFATGAPQDFKIVAKRCSEIINGKDDKDDEDGTEPAAPDQSSEKLNTQKSDENKDCRKPKIFFKYKHVYQKSLEEHVKTIIGELPEQQNEEDAAAKPVAPPSAPAPAGANEMQQLEKKKNKQVEYKPFTKETIAELFKLNESVPDAGSIPSPYNLDILMRRAPDELEPGNDILITIKAFEPFVYEYIQEKPDRNRLAYQLFHHNIVLTGRNTLADIMDTFMCHEQGCRNVVQSNEKETRSGFIYMQKAFYMDKGEKAAVHEQAIEDWRAKRNFGDHPKLDMRTTKLANLNFTLGEYDLYIHNSECAHILQVTEIRVVGMDDPKFLSDYPRSNSLALSYRRSRCKECRVFDPLWIVENYPNGSTKLVYYCNACLRNFLYNRQELNMPMTWKLRPNLPKRANSSC